MEKIDPEKRNQPDNSENWEFDKSHFWSGFVLGVIIVLIVFVIRSNPSMGNTVVNWAYDYLVIRDFKQNMEEKEKQESAPPISDHIRIIAFDKDTYDNSSSQGFWTPRQLLGECILKSAKMGAKVIFIDFLGLNRPAPVCERQNNEDENMKFLELLDEAAGIIASSKNNAVILLPRTEVRSPRNDYERRYNRLYNKVLDDNKDVIRWASVGIFKDPSDYDQTRHFRFYKKDENDNVFFSVYILVALYLQVGRIDGDTYLKKARKDILSYDSETSSASVDPICEIPNLKKPIYIYPQHHYTQARWFQNGFNCGDIQARYLFHLVPTEVLSRLGGGLDPLTQHSELRLTPEDLFKKDGNIYERKAVLIGSDNPEMGDVHLTPIGKMNGIFLVANGVNLFLEGLQLHTPSVTFTIFIDFLTVLFIATVFAYIPYSDKLWTLLITLILIIACLIILRYVSLDLLKYGLFAESVFPIIGIIIDRLWAMIKESIKNHIDKERKSKKKECLI